MLTQNDAMILAGLPIHDGSAGARAERRCRTAPEADPRPSRLQILLEPTGHLVTLVRAWLGAGATPDRKAPSI